MKLRGRNFEWDFNEKTYVMGILNITPDSFSDGGRYNNVEQAVARAEKMIEDGADVLDIGGESTRPGASFVEVDEELKRVIPIIEAIYRRFPNVPISIDTYKSHVAKEAIEAGAAIINDVWGAKWDGTIAKVAAQTEAPIILMHNQKEVGYRELIGTMIEDLSDSVRLCKEAGVSDDKIVLDPGIGFAKTYEQNLEVMNRLHELKALHYPILLGTSRKSLIGLTLNLPAEERMEGTGATVCLGIERGSNIIRVHDVKEMARMAKMMDAMLGKGRNNG